MYIFSKRYFQRFHSNIQQDQNKWKVHKIIGFTWNDISGIRRFEKRPFVGKLVSSDRTDFPTKALLSRDVELYCFRCGKILPLCAYDWSGVATLPALVQNNYNTINKNSQSHVSVNCMIYKLDEIAAYFQTGWNNDSRDVAPG